MVDSGYREFGLVGRKLGHSMSPELFRSIFKKYDVRAAYHLLEMERIDEVCLLPLRYPLLYGFNVTVPYKESILPYLDNLSDVAREIEAVNTVYIDRTRNGKNGAFQLWGHNTDYSGFLHSLDNFEINGGKALVLGSGGASRAVSKALLSKKMDVMIVSRTPHPYHINCNEKSSIPVISYLQIDKVLLNDTDIVINATPAGMWPEVESGPPFPWHLIDKHIIFYDLIYNPRITLFMRKALEQGATAMNGLRMLEYQAFDAWNFWSAIQTNKP